MIISKKSKRIIFRQIASFSFYFSLTLFGVMILYIFYEGFLALKTIPISEFLYSDSGTIEWKPTSSPPRYSMIPLLWGSFLTTFLAILISIFWGLILAVYLSDFCPKKTKKYYVFFLENIGGIPTVVLGFFVFAIGADFLAAAVQSPNRFNAFVASLTISIIITPIFSLMLYKAFNSIDMDLKEMAYSLGASKLKTLTMVVIPHSVSSIKSAFFISLARALGETMIPLMIAGNAASVDFNIFAPTRTIPAAIAAEMGEAPRNSEHFHALFLIALVLIIIEIIFFSISKISIKKNVKERNFNYV